ncbi:LuxR family transcriptional regulator [Burkholderiaceae bacterium DAT-1]|nr:LuxR family transcriptional regulator [Burkholderiaceae bacterium DAT-1]
MRARYRAKAALAAFGGDFSALYDTRTPEEIREALMRYVTALGFHYFHYSVRCNLRNEPTQFTMSNYPQRWQNRYAKRGFENFDPPVLHCKTRVTPIIWTNELYHDETARKILAGGRQYGLNVGVSYPVHAVSGELAIFSLVTREEEDIAQQWIRPMLATGHQLALHLHEAVMQMMETAPEMGERRNSCLTPRETQCVELAARGMTAREIARQLEIAETTVIYHFKRAGEKLGTTDRTRIVAKAMGLGIIAWEEGNKAPPPRPQINRSTAR